jgi:hypothetical protein
MDTASAMRRQKRLENTEVYHVGVGHALTFALTSGLEVGDIRPVWPKVGPPCKVEHGPAQTRQGKCFN